MWCMASYYLRDIPPGVLARAKRAAKIHGVTLKARLLAALAVLAATDGSGRGVRLRHDRRRAWGKAR